MGWLRQSVKPDGRGFGSGSGRGRAAWSGKWGVWVQRDGSILASIGPCELGFDPIEYLINKKLKLKS